MNDDNSRQLPQNDLDFNLMTTDSVWGKAEISPELKDRLMKYYQEYDKDGNVVITKSSLWGLLGFYTRDMRLANLSSFDNELNVCRYYLDLANDLLSMDMIEPFAVCLSRAATILETSQSKAGFLRRIMNTLRHENLNQTIEPPKKGFFGGNKNRENGGF